MAAATRCGRKGRRPLKRVLAILFVTMCAAILWLVLGRDADGAPITTPMVPLVSAQPIAPATANTTDREPGPAATTMDPNAAPTTAAMDGEIRISVMRQTASGDRRPVGAGHAVAVERIDAVDGWGDRHERLTDEHGVVVLRLAAGPWLATVGGGSGLQFESDGTGTRNVTLVLVDGYRLEGLVTDPDGRAIAGAEVASGDAAHRLLTIGRTDAEGRFAFEPLHGHRLVAVAHPLFAASATRPVHGNPGDTVPVRFTLVPAAGKLLTTVVGATGRPVPGARVALTPATTDGHAARTFVLKAGDDGTVASPPLPAGTVRIEVRAGGHGSWSDRAQVHSGTTANVTVRLPRPARVVGVARDADGKPVLARIWTGENRAFGSHATLTAADGTFRLDDLGPGETVLRARAAGHQDVETTRGLAPGNEARWDIEFEVADPERALAGRVIDHRGEPLAGWRVVAQDLGPGARGVGKHTAADGTFTLNGLPRGSKMRVTVRPAGADLMTFAAAVLDEVPVGSRDLLLRVDDPQLAMGRISGRITDAAGLGVAARIDIWHEGGRSATYRANDAGNFDLAGIPIGEVHLSFAHPDHPTRSLPDVHVQPGAREDLGTLQFEPPAFLAGSLIGPDGVPPTAATIRLLNGRGEVAGTATLQGGRWNATPVGPGSYRVSVQAQGCAPASTPITLVAGERKELRIELRVGLPRRIRVRAPAGADCGSWASLAVADEHGDRQWEAGLAMSDGVAEFLVFMPAGNHPVAVRARRGWQALAVVPFAEGDLPPIELELSRPR